MKASLLHDENKNKLQIYWIAYHFVVSILH